jgi:hypothetical protein
MSLVKIQGNANGTGEFIIAAPNSNNNNILTLPDNTGTIVTTATTTGIDANAISTGTLNNARTTASSSNVADAIVQRDASGNFTANVITADGSSITSINANNISSGTLGVARGGTGATTLDANNVILGNGTSAVQFVAPGTNGNVLTSNGTTWTSAAAGGGGGSFVFLGSATAASSVVDFTGLNTTTYNSFLITFTDVRTSGLSVRLYPGGTLQTGNQYMYVGLRVDSGGVGPAVATSSAANIILDGTQVSTANLGRSGYVHFCPAGGYSTVTGVYMLLASTVNPIIVYQGGSVSIASESNGIRFLSNANGNLTAGNFWLYGIKSS